MNSTKENNFKSKLFLQKQSGIDLYTGDWTALQVTHLLRRTTFGVGQEAIDAFIDQGLEASVEVLLASIPLADPPLNFNDNNDPNVSIGETWVNAGKAPDSSTNNKRRQSLRAWTIGRALSKEIHIREKMTLFWHNHFVVADTGNALAQYNYINLLRSNCLGNIKQLTKDIVIDASMLDYLNGDENTKGAPNENFARELLELFTIGKGPLIAPGDYTHYTETDIKEMARVLTGWRDLGYGNTEFNDIKGEFRLNRHDIESKQLSEKFGNAVINNEGEEEYKTLIDIIFQQDEVSRFMVRNIYRWFVNHEISSEVETNIIEPLAQLLREQNYEVKPLLSVMLKSEFFYADCIIGCMIKNPMDFVLSTLNIFNVQVTEELSKQYVLWRRIYDSITLNQMAYFYHPSVAGWKAYYQSPGYYHIWLSSVTLPLRQNYMDLLANGSTVQGNFFGIDVLSFVEGLENPTNLDELILGYERLIYCKPLSLNQRLQMKEVVLQGLPDFEWTIEYGDYVANPDDEDKKLAIENKLILLTLNMLRLPEYHLS